MRTFSFVLVRIRWISGRRGVETDESALVSS